MINITIMEDIIVKLGQTNELENSILYQVQNH